MLKRDCIKALTNLGCILKNYNVLNLTIKNKFYVIVIYRFPLKNKKQHIGYIVTYTDTYWHHSKKYVKPTVKNFSNYVYLINYITKLNNT